MNARKVIHGLRAISDEERATAKKARASWQILTIMAEFIEASEHLSELRHAISIYGGARFTPDSAEYLPPKKSAVCSPTPASPLSPAAAV